MLKKLKNKIFINFYLLLRFGNFIPKGSKVAMGSNARVYGSRLDGNVSIGDYCTISRTELYGDIEIGKFTSINGPNTDLVAYGGSISIGNFCSVARNVSMQVSNHNVKRMTTYPIMKNFFNSNDDNEFVSKGNITIGHDVWIGAHCLVLSGAQIDNGAVIAANSVVTGKIPAYSIAAGSPAKVIKYRFKQEKIKKLQELKWWHWSIEQLKSNKLFFLNGEI